MDSQFEHLCRICAADTKCKNNSVVESVFIFKTSGLKDKIARHLFLNVAEEDPLPKVLCKSCYRQVEATASLSNIAKHTQRVFQDFLISTVPKHARQPTDTVYNSSPVPAAPTHNISDSESSSNNQKRYCSNIDNDTYYPKSVTRPPETSVPPSLQLTACSQNRDVVISLTNTNAEMRQQQKQQQQHKPTDYTNNRSSIKMNNLMLPARRNSVFVDTRYSSAPMSIAQRSMQLPPSLASLHHDVALSKASKNSIQKKHSPAGVINFIQTHGRITGNAPPPITPTTIDKEYNKTCAASASATAPAPATQKSVVSAGLPNLPKSVVQQKRRNLKNTLNNISAIRDGQVSLLKSSQQRRTAEDIDFRPLVTTTVVPHQSLYGVEPSVEEALPEHIIIAAPKKKKEEPSYPARPSASKLQKSAASASKSVRALPDACTATEVATKSKTPPSISCLTDAISLGNVIRDPDLLKLILKALKWPVTAGNSDEQMTRLKNSKFAVIMSDNNLLQDTDLTQLLGPYLGPMMAVIQQQNKNPPASTSVKTSTPASTPQATDELRTIGDCTMPYKLPPETSVQLVPSCPMDQEQPRTLSSKSVDTDAKLAQRKSRAEESFVDRQPSSAASKSKAALVTNELLNINSMLISQFGANPADALNEALISMLKQQQESKSQRPSRRCRSSSRTYSPPNLEDIVLVEPQTSLELLTAPVCDVPTVTMPPQQIAEPPPITRPIIKRRKAVLQTSKQNCLKYTNQGDISMLKTDESTSNNELTKETASSAECYQSMEASVVQQAVETSQAPTSTVPEINLSNTHDSEPECSTENTAFNATLNDVPNEQPSLASARKPNVKSALGQKLLEAIGLPQPGNNVPPESSRDTLRSALKRSLKQAQEQQQQLKRVKHEEPVKQMADSTTKPVAGESSDEHKKAIAERELELLKRKTKNAEKSNLSLKDDKSERTDVSSSSSRNRRNRQKSKTDANEDDSFAEERKSERWDEDDDLPLKTEIEKNKKHSYRPTRTSKTMSKYYKNPRSDKALSPQKSQHAMGRRSTRQR